MTGDETTYWTWVYERSRRVSPEGPFRLDSLEDFLASVDRLLDVYRTLGWTRRRPYRWLIRDAENYDKDLAAIWQHAPSPSTSLRKVKIRRPKVNKPKVAHWRTLTFRFPQPPQWKTLVLRFDPPPPQWQKLVIRFDPLPWQTLTFTWPKLSTPKALTEHQRQKRAAKQARMRRRRWAADPEWKMKQQARQKKYYPIRNAKKAGKKCNKIQA